MSDFLKTNFLKRMKVGDTFLVIEGIYDWELTKVEEPGNLPGGKMVYELELKSIKKSKVTFE